MIYFIHDPTADRIKIGKSKDVPLRLQGLRRRYGDGLALLASVVGSFPEEGQLHRQFGHLRLDKDGREWFRADAELLDFIESMKRGEPLFVVPTPEPIRKRRRRSATHKITKGEHGGKRPGAGRPRKSERDDTVTKFDRTLLGMARMVATAKGVTIAEYISEAARSTIERDFAREMKRLEGSGE